MKKYYSNPTSIISDILNQVTILFADIAGFTKLSSITPAEQVV